MARRWVSVVAAVVGIFAWAPAMWWLVGLVSHGVSADSDPDYLVRPIRLPIFVEPTIGAVGVVLVVVGMLSRRRALPGWSQIFTAFSAMCAYAGLTYRVATTPVIGANIGGGGLILFSVPFTIGMVVWIVIAVLDLRRLSRRSARTLREATNTPEAL